MPLTQENPSYFDDRLKDFQSKREIAIPVAMKSPRSEKFQVISRRNDEVVSEDEFDVFLSSCESSNSYDAKSRMSNLYINRPTNSLNRQFHTPEEAKKMNEITCSNDHTKSTPRKASGSLTRKIGQFLWKSKSKNSVGSETLSLNSPTFSPDSSLSIYTNSLDSSDSQSHSSSSNSNQISPKDLTSINNNNTLAEDQFCSYSYDDCETYAANMYYNMGDVTSFTYRLRPRNNSIPLSANTMRRRALTDSVEPYYNNTTFSTFPNPRRHSIAYSSASTATTSTNKLPEKEEKSAKSSTTVKLGPDGYLVPNESQNIRNKKNLYVNEPQVEVRVDVHTPTSSNSAEFPISTSNDSTGTLVAGEIYSLQWDEQHDKNKKQKNNLMADTSRREAHEQHEKKHCKISQDKVLPLYMSRVLLASSDCEPFCSLCSSSVLTSGWKKSNMDVAIISCQECFFSRNAEAHVKGFFERMVSPDNKKMEIVLQSYDLKDMDHQATVAEVHQAKVQIVIVSHHFLDRLKHEATMRKKLSPINRVLRSKRVISILLGMSSQYIIEGYQLVLARFHEWYSVELRSTSKLDPEFCRKFTEQVVRIYNIELTNTSNFSVFPKKITNDQQKVAVVLKAPLGTKDELRIELSRGRGKEILSDNITTNPFTAIIRIPDSLCSDRTALIEITVFLNQRKLGTKLIKYEYSARGQSDDAIERMIHNVPGFLKLLDDNISQSLSKNLNDGTDYLTDSSLELMNDILLSRSDEFPTVMHFAAHYGLEQSVWVMLEKGDCLKQISICNSNGKNSIDIAKERGHPQIVQPMKNFLEVTNTMEAFQYMKQICEKTVIIMDRKSESENEAMEQDEEQEREQEISGAVLSENYVEVESSQEESSGEMLADKESNIVPENEVSKPNEISVKVEAPVVPKPNSRSIKKPKPTYENLSAEDRAEIIRLTNLTLSKWPEPESEPPKKPPKAQVLKPPPSPSPMQNYDIPRLTDQAYSIPPTPRPVIRPPVSPSLQKKPLEPIQTTGYIVMESDPKMPAAAGDCSDLMSKYLPPTPEEEMESIKYPRASPEPAITLRHPHKYPSRMGQGRAPVISPAPVPVFDPTEEELIDLMTNFKNNVYNIRELELLFDNWKERSDVQRSIEEKNKDLEKMREDYKRIQAEAIKSSRKMSAFDRIRRMLPGGKKKHSNAGLNGDASSLKGSSLTLDQEEITYPLTPTVKLPPSNSPRGIPRMKHMGSNDRTSMESGASGGSAAGPDSGMSDPDSDKDKEKDLVESKPVTNTNVADTWTDVLTKRFIASYIGPNPLPTSLLDGGDEEDDDEKRDSEDVRKMITQVVVDDGSYKIPPMPIPINKPLPKPQPSMEKIEETPKPKVNYPPPPPKKKMSLAKTFSKTISKESISSPPPPPPRNHKTPNVFNYIDYKNKAGLDGKPILPKKPLKDYENTGEDT